MHDDIELISEQVDTARFGVSKFILDLLDLDRGFSGLANLLLILYLSHNVTKLSSYYSMKRIIIVFISLVSRETIEVIVLPD